MLPEMGKHCWWPEFQSTGWMISVAETAVVLPWLLNTVKVPVKLPRGSCLACDTATMSPTYVVVLMTRETVTERVLLDWTFCAAVKVPML